MKNKADRNDKIFDIILEEAFDKYAADIANQDVECEMTEEEIRTMENKEKIIYDKLMKEIDADKKNRISVKKVCVLVAVLLLGIIVVSFSVSAIYNKWVQRTNLSMSGTDLNVNTQKLIFEDYNNIRNFENKSEIIIPNWLPEGMELNRMTDEANNLIFYYKKGDNWVTITTNPGIGLGNSKIDTKNNNYETTTDEILGMECSIVTSTSETGLTMYSAHWNSSSTNYTLMTNSSEFYKIMENLIYLED